MTTPISSWLTLKIEHLRLLKRSVSPRPLEPSNHRTLHCGSTLVLYHVVYATVGFIQYQEQSDLMTTQTSRNRKILLSGCLFHLFHDSIADGWLFCFPSGKLPFSSLSPRLACLWLCFEGATAMFQTPAGFLGERYGERRLLTLGTFVTALSVMGLAFTGNIYLLCVLLLIGGLGAGVQHPLASSMISKAYAQGNRRIALGTYNFSGTWGNFSSRLSLPLSCLLWAGDPSVLVTAFLDA